MQVTVIIPTFNRAAMLPLAVHSVVAQSYQDLEILIVDDGSTDETPRVVEGLCRMAARKITYIRKENGGCASARNLGLREAKGEFIAFLDSDDWLLPRKLELQVAALEAVGADLAFGPWYDYYVDAEQYVGPLYPVAFQAPKDFAREHFVNTNFSFTCAVVRRECFDIDAAPFDETMRWNEDSDLAQRIALAGYQWTPVHYPSFVRRVHPGSKSQDRVRIYEQLLNSALRIGETQPQFRAGLGRAYDQRIAQLYGLLARAHFRQGCIAARTSLVQAVEHSPHLKAAIWSQTRDLRVFTRVLGQGHFTWRQLAPNWIRRLWRRWARRSHVWGKERVGGHHAQRPEQVLGAPPIPQP